MLSSFSYSPAEIKKIEQIQFGILSPENIETMSVVECVSPEVMLKGKPKEGGLLDPRMGSVDKHIHCSTCNGDMKSCPGHFGHIKLAKPVFHIGYLNTTVKLLQCVCIHCGMLLCDESKEEIKQAKKIKNRKERFKAMHALIKGTSRCFFGPSGDNANNENADGAQPTGANSGCSGKQPKINREGLKIMAEFKDSDQPKGPLSAEQVLAILKRISDEDIKKLGFHEKYARPEFLIITHMPVPPPSVRPSIHHGGTQRGEDDLTFKLIDILKHNSNVARQEQQGVAQHLIEEEMDRLQFHVATYMDNDMAGLPKATHKSGRPIKSIRARLRSKEGRVRGNLMGKRVDFSARTVITGDPFLSIDQVGVPRTIAKNLTFPEVVTPFNMEKLYQLIQNGPDKHPGAKYVVQDNGVRRDLHFVQNKSDIQLELGQVVERHIQDGDVVLFNRQPSLHKMSMMGHRIRVMPYSTFRLNLSVTTPYNADFDGDEMNLHVPQSLQTKAELINLMMVPKNIITPKSNAPVIGVVQDALLGSSLLTRRDTFLEREYLMLCLMHLHEFDGKIPVPAILKPKPLWTGKQLFSTILPIVNLTRASSEFAPDKETDPNISFVDGNVLIDKGDLLSGICDGKTLGRSAGGLIHVICQEFNTDEARRFLDSCQRLVNTWMLQHGYTIGIGDTIADANVMRKIRNIIQDAGQKVKELLRARQIDRGLQLEPGRTLRETFELKVNGVLNAAREEAGNEAQKSLRERNNFKLMVSAGSKGSILNISQIITCVGQQNVEGKRIPNGYRNRTLPHFCQDDDGPEARGFVENSYLQGLTPQEFFFHTMGGREGLIDTAVKTSETGYIQRKLIKAMEDVMVKYDGTVRDAEGNVVQFLYGEDGMDAVKLEHQNFTITDNSDAKFDRAFKFDVDANQMLKGMENYLQPEIIQSYHDNPQKLLALHEEYEQLKRDRQQLRTEVFRFTKDSKTPQPVNLDRTILNAKKVYNIVDGRTKSDLDPVEIVEQLRELKKELIVVKGDDFLSIEAQENATMLFNIFLRSTLSAKRVICDHHLDKRSFSWVLSEIKQRFTQAQAQPGEMVGAIAAQSIGEPATQMTLNTFHNAGVSSKNVTLGVPRLKELISVAKQPKTPFLTVFLKDNIREDSESIKKVQTKLEYTTLGSVVARSEIYYDPNLESSVVEEDTSHDWVYAYLEHESDQVKERISPWLLRLVLDKQSIVDMQIESIADAIRKEFGEEDVKIACSPDNADTPVIRIRILREESHTEKEIGEGGEEIIDDKTVEFLRKLEENMLSELPLRGIPNIRKVFFRALKAKRYTANGEDKKYEENVLDTDGVNLAAVLSIEEVDNTRTISNDVVEIFNVLGIEATRAALFKELRAVIEFDGSYVNYRHLAILCDVMCHRGSMMAITRHGVNRTDTGPMMRASFEETVEIFFEAAMFADKDPLRGVSANIMCGQLAPIGTGYFDLFIDESLLSSAVDTRQYMDAMGSGMDYDGAQSPYSSRMIGSPGASVSTPYMAESPHGSVYSPKTPGTPFGETGAVFSPTVNSPMSEHGLGSGAFSPYGATSPSHAYSPSSPSYTPTSPGYSPSSPSYSPSSPSYSPSSPSYSPSSPAYSPSSPAYSPSSPAYSPSSPAYSPSSPAYSPSSPAYSPSSPAYSPSSPAYSPSSPAYNPNSKMGSKSGASPSSPAYSPSSPSYSPSSPSYSPSSPNYSPSSPNYSPSSPGYSPSSPSYSPSSPAYSPSYNNTKKPADKQQEDEDMH